MEFHPYANWFPLIDGEEFNALVEDIKEKGLLLPITTYEDKILDGRNRYRACVKAGVEPRFKEYAGSAPAGFVCSVNIRRRDLTSSQKAAIAVMMLPALEAEAKKRQGMRTDIVEIIPQSSFGDKSRDTAADMFDTNPRYVQDAKKIKQESPELLEKVRSGEVTIPEAKRLLVSETEDEEDEEDGVNMDDDDDFIHPESLEEIAHQYADEGYYEEAIETLQEADDLQSKMDEADIEVDRFSLKVKKLAGYILLDDWQAMSETERKQHLDVSGEAKFNSQGDNENIEWALWSWNPITGCLHNCPYCYARDIAERFYEQKFVPSLWPGRLVAPQNTPFPETKAKAWVGHKNVFTCSMADLFGRWVPSEWIELVLDAVRAAPKWNFLFLTKFPQRMAEFRFPDNAWVGTTVDCQARVANAERAFKKIKAGVKWLSCEPLIEPLHFTDLSMFNWLVIGGSSKSSQTPEWHPPRSWVNDLEDKARQCGVKVYEKSNLLERVREYPGVESTAPLIAPEQLRYLPSQEKP